MMDRIVTLLLTCDVGTACNASPQPFIGATDEEARTAAEDAGWRFGPASHLCADCWAENEAEMARAEVAS